MFSIKSMDLYDFEAFCGFWGGAKIRWDEMTDDEKDYLNDFICGVEFDNLIAINDFVLFDSDEILEEYHENR